jgi:hypothetical protein
LGDLLSTLRIDLDAVIAPAPDDLQGGWPRRTLDRESDPLMIDQVDRLNGDENPIFVSGFDR